MSQLQNDSFPKSRQDLQQFLFSHSYAAGSDLRGFMVYDCKRRKVGTIGDIYCDRATLRPRYVEIIPHVGADDDKAVFYPYSYINYRHGEGCAFVDIAKSALLTWDEFAWDHILQIEGRELITFNEALGLEAESVLATNDYQLCA